VESRNAERVRLRAERSKLTAADPLGGSWLTSSRRWGIDPDAGPSLGQVLKLRRERMDEVREVIAGTKAAELERNCVPPESPGHPRKDHTVLQCPHVILRRSGSTIGARSGTSRCSRNGPADRASSRPGTRHRKRAASSHSLGLSLHEGW
jgi:hypothetical protein